MAPIITGTVRGERTTASDIERTSTQPPFLQQKDLPSGLAPSSVVPIHDNGPGGNQLRGKQHSQRVRVVDKDTRLRVPGLDGERRDYVSPYSTDSDSDIRVRRDNTVVLKLEEEAIAIFINPLKPQDVTVHMSLPLRDDLECVLEDFSRMRRLGRFREALDLFDEQLAHFIDNRYVLVQYGLCLYEAGHIARLSELADKHRPSRRPKDALQLCWTLLVSVADVVLPDMEPNMRFDDIVPTIAAMLTGSWPGLSSVEVRD